MNDTQPYIEIPRTKGRPERIDALLAKRMTIFLLSRRHRRWRREGR